MRKKQTFLLTVMASEEPNASFCGKIKVISSGETRTFTSLEELHRFIASEMERQNIQRRYMDEANADDFRKQTGSLMA